MKNGKNLHVPLPAELHDQLREVAAQLGKPATVLAREAIERHLKGLKKQAIDAAITEWAAEFAGTELDLDSDLEAAGLEFLRKNA
jgi:predicted DNA-binding protein